MTTYRDHPNYSAGYHDALEDRGQDVAYAQTREYQAGWLAGLRAVEIFESCGFERDARGGFQKVFVIPGGAK